MKSGLSRGNNISFGFHRIVVVVANEEDNASSYCWEAQGLQTKYCNISTRVRTDNLWMKTKNKLQDVSIV